MGMEIRDEKYVALLQGSENISRVTLHEPQLLYVHGLMVSAAEFNHGGPSSISKRAENTSVCEFF